MNIKEKEKNYIFMHQIAECLLVLTFVWASYIGGAELIYHNMFPFGILSGACIYGTVSAISVLFLGANKYFCIKEKAMPELVTLMFASVVLVNLIFVALLYFSRSMRLSVYFFIIADTLQIGMLFICKIYFSKFKQKILLKRKTLIIGVYENRYELVKAVRGRGAFKCSFIDFKNQNLKKYLAYFDVIYLAGEVDKKYKDEIVSHCLLLEKDIFLVPETYEISLRKSKLTQVGDVPVFNIEPYRLSESQKLIKRVMDICGAAAGLVITFPIMAIVCVMIKCEDRGPAFYKQVRSGRNGKEFEVIKFRSMKVDAEKLTGAVFAADKDPRITKVGGFIRAARIDEIPQFINVLAGDMSLVGPRPERPVFVEKFCEEISEYKNRLAVKPGITGLAQVLGNYTTTAVNKARFDMVYIQEYSLMLDIKILFKTLKVVFTKEQAAGFGDAEYSEETVQGFEFEIVGASAGGENSGTSEYQPFVKVERGFSDIKLNRGEKRKQRTSAVQRALKTALVACCCLTIISGSMMLRYVSFAAEAFNLYEEGSINTGSGNLQTAEDTLNTDIPITVASADKEYIAAMVEAEGQKQSPKIQGGDNIVLPANLLSMEGGNFTADQGNTAGESSDDALINPPYSDGTAGMAGGITGTDDIMNTTGGNTDRKIAQSQYSIQNQYPAIALSEEHLQEAMDKITTKDKIDAVIMLVTRLTTEDIMALEEMSKGGFTVEEKARAKEMMYAYYNEEEVKKIYGLYKAYVR